MKILNVIYMIGALILSCGCSDGKPELTSQNAKESYSLGFRFGENMKFQETQLDFDAYMSGIRDGLEGKEPRLAQEDIEKFLMGLQQKMVSAQQKSQKKKAETNLSEAESFLMKNKEKEGVVTLPSGLQYKVITEGTGAKPQKDSSVTVNYRGTFVDGTEFDSSYTRGEPATFKVDGVISGWTEALLLMREGAKWQLFIPPDLAYGVRGAPPQIPPNSVLIFEVELIDIQASNKGE